MKRLLFGLLLATLVANAHAGLLDGILNPLLPPAPGPAPSRPVGAPEIDAAAGSIAVALVAGGLALIKRARRNRG